MGFLGHIIAANGVHLNLEKIKSMVEWVVPKNLKMLRGFLGLTGYYRRFIKTYHPKKDGQTEVINRILEMYLRSYCHENPKLWLDLLNMSTPTLGRVMV